MHDCINSPIHKLKKEVLKIKDYYQLISEKKKICKEIRNQLVPCVSYSKYPLKAKDNLEILKDNSIRFIVSNNGKNKISDIVKIEYNLNGEYREFYIRNKTTLDSQLIDYGEKDLYYRNVMQFKNNYYNIIPKNFAYYYFEPRVIDESITSRYISVLAEYKTGINDVTLIDKTLVDLEEAMLCVINNVKVDKKINLVCTESKTLLKDILNRDCSSKFIDKINKVVPTFDI